MNNGQLKLCAGIIKGINETFQPDDPLYEAIRQINLYALSMLEAEEAGLLVKLQAPIGKTIYMVSGERIDSCVVEEVRTDGKRVEYTASCIGGEMWFTNESFGSTVFRTHIAAAESLAQSDGH